MKQNINIEAEKNELILRNEEGDYAIIPAKHRFKVQKMIDEGCHGCIDALVDTLPVMEDYAQDGSIYPSVRTTKFDDTTENKYQQWRASLPKNLQYEGDYDLRGFYKENPDFNINDSEQHLTDKWKLPNHPTFSDESVYYKGNENYGGKWKSYDYGDVYTPNNPEVKQQKLEWKKGFYSKDKVVVDGKLYDINTPEYKKIYDKGIGYFDKTGTFISSKEDLPEVTVSSKIQPNTVSSYISEFGKQTPKEEYLQNKSREHEKEFYSAPLWAQQVVGGYNEERKKSDRKRDEEDYNKLQSNFIAEKLLNRNKQKDNETRVQWLQRFSDKELEVIKNSDYKSKIEPSIWSKFEQGLLSIVNAGSPVTFKNENLTKEEAKQEDNPLNILQPLSIPTKMVQSIYKDDYSFTDALKGKKNNAGIVEDIVTDPLNLVGLGIWSKLSKANKFKNLDEAYNAIKTLDKVSLEKKLGNTISNEDWQYLYRVQEKGFDIERPTLKAIEDRVSAGEGKWYDYNILNNLELRANMQSRDKYYGQWFDSDPKRLDYYLADKGEEVDILRTKVPKKILDQYRIDKIDPEIAKKWSLSHETEYIVPKDLIQQAEKFDKKDWQKLIDEHERVKQLSKVVNKVDDITENLKHLEYAKNYYSKYGYNIPENLAEIAKNSKLTDETIQGLVNQHNTFVRGVSTNWDEIAKRNPEILRHLEGKGIDYINNPQAAAEYMSTHVPIQTGYGRAGFGKNLDNIDAIYTSNSIPTAEGYTYGDGYIVKVKRPTDFSSKNRIDWIKHNDFDYDNVSKLVDQQSFNDLISLKNYYQNNINKIDDILPSNYPLSKQDILSLPQSLRDEQVEKIIKEIVPKEKQTLFGFEEMKKPIRKMESKIDMTTNDYYDLIDDIEDDVLYGKIADRFKQEETRLNKKLNSLVDNSNEYEYASFNWYKSRLKYQEEAQKIISENKSEYIKILQDEFGITPNRYAHYLHIGKEGDKLLEPIEAIRITPDIWKNKSRAHTNMFTKGMSAGSLIPFYLYLQSKNQNKNEQ